MLDTNIVTDLVRNPAGKAAARLAAVGDDGIAISIIVAAEIRFGLAKLGSRSLSARVEAVLHVLPVIAFDRPADEHYGDIRNALRKSGRMIGPNDLFIAAHARALGVPLVTNNVAKFKRVEGLEIEDWLE